MSRRRALAAVLTLLLVGIVGACGIPKDDSPRLIAEAPEGFGTTTQPAEGSGALVVEVYLIDGREDPQLLVAKERPTEKLPGPIEAVNRLLAGTTKEDDRDGYKTVIPLDTRLLPDSGVRDGVVVLDLSSEISTITGDLAVQAYAQLVYTATQFDKGPREVQFMIEGEPTKAPTDGEQMDQVDKNDYQKLRPPA